MKIKVQALRSYSEAKELIDKLDPLILEEFRESLWVPGSVRIHAQKSRWETLCGIKQENISCQLVSEFQPIDCKRCLKILSKLKEVPG